MSGFTWAEYDKTKHLTRREKTILDDLILYFESYYIDDEDIDGNIIKPDKNALRKNKDIFDEIVCTFYNNRSLIDNSLKKISDTNEIDEKLSFCPNNYVDI